MSKIAERLPTLPTREERLEVTTSVLEDVVQDGRFEKDKLVEAVESRLSDVEVNETILIREGRKSIADNLVAAWANNATIKLDRTQRVPVYQLDLGFKNSFFKVGSTFVLPHAMTIQDFEVMLERKDRRIENAQTDRAILAEFYERARPGLEAGQNLVEQFDAGTLELAAVVGTPELADGEESEDAGE